MIKSLKIFKHRVNKVTDISDLQPGWGVELDLRSDVSQKGALHLSHDPWVKGEDFSQWLGVYLKRNLPGTLILNTKEDGLESCAIEILESKKFTDYFFLDTCLPTLVKWTHVENKKHFAVRLSQFEPPEQVVRFKNKVEWLWVDCFFGQPISREWVERLSADFKICLVSPELQGQDVGLIESFKIQLGDLADGVCTKRPDLWLTAGN